MENEVVYSLTKADIICKAREAMEDCSAYMNNGSRKLASRARGIALHWEFVLYFNLGVDDSEWKDSDYESMVARADAMDI